MPVSLSVKCREYCRICCHLVKCGLWSSGCATLSPQHTGLRRVVVVARAGVWIESGNMSVVATNGNRTTTRRLEQVRRGEMRAGNDGKREKGEMNERRGVEVGSWAGLCVSRAGIWYIGASSSNDNEKAPPMCCSALPCLLCLCASLCVRSLFPSPLFIH